MSSRLPMQSQNFIDFKQESASLSAFQFLQSWDKAAVERYQLRMSQHEAAHCDGRFDRYVIACISESKTQYRLRRW